MVILLVQQTTAQNTCGKPTKMCKREKGTCIGKSEPCFGTVAAGKKWCGKAGKNCKCCYGEDIACGDGAEQPSCTVLGGHCMNKDDNCEGREVYSQYFCSGSSCKCCIPEEVCPSCKDQAGEQCGGDVFGMDFGGVCKDYCGENEMRLGDCGRNCGCCVPLDLPNVDCKVELGKTCGGDAFGVSYSGTCRTNCNDDERMVAPCGYFSAQRSIQSIFKKRMDDDCGCCVKIDLTGKK